jgi:hypothetical protein
MSGLEDFAQRHPTRKGQECGACILRRERPALWAEVPEGRRRGISFTTIAQYLRTKDASLTFSQLRDHFLKGHDA